MMKQSKNKKGRLAKSSLSVILAASMVMTSSSFVWASPVQEVPSAEIMQIDEIVGEATIVKVAAAAESTYIYNGIPQTPELAFANDKGEPIAINSAYYTVVVKGGSESDGTNAGEATYTVTLNEDVNFSFAENQKSADVKITIEAATLTPSMVEGTKNLTYNGEDQTPDFAFTQDEEPLKLEKGTDYTVSATDMKNVGAGKKITLNLVGDTYGSSNYKLEEGSADNLTYDITAAKITPMAEDVVYSGQEQIPETVDFHGLAPDETLTVEDDYTITPTPEGDYTNVGKKEVTVTLVSGENTAKNYEIEEKDTTVAYSIIPSEITVTDNYHGTYQYTGKEVLPELSFEEIDFEEGEDYKIVKTGKDYVTPGEKSVDVQLIGDAAAKYRLSKSTFEYAVETANVEVRAKADAYDNDGNALLPYNGKSQVPELEFTNEDGNSVSLVKGKDYTTTVDYDTTSVGKKTIKVMMLNKECKLAKNEITYEITPVDINNSSITIKKGESFVYNGKEQHPTVAEAYVWLDGKKVSLVEGVDYEVTGATNVADEKIPVTVKGINNYKGTKDTGATFEIEPATFNKRNIEVAAMKLLYDGTVQTPAPKLSIAETGVELELNKDYTMTVADKDSKTPGIYDVTFKAAGKNFKAGGTVDATYQIAEELTLKECLVNAIVTDKNGEVLKKDSDGVWVGTYTGTEEGFDLKLDDNNTDIKENVDYTVEVPDVVDCVNAGSYSITIIGKKGYAGETVTIPFLIAPKPLNGKSTSDFVDKDGTVKGGLNENVSISATLGMTHDKVRAENAALVIKDGDKILTAGTDYTYTTDKTTGTVCITGTGNYTTVYGEKDKVKTFTSKYALIDQLSINDPTITVAVSGTYTYTGTDIKPGADKLEIKEGNYRLQDKVDYKILGYDKNIYAGTAEITIEGIGDYTGERVLTFTIIGSALADAYEFEAITDVTYDGKDHKAEFDSKTLPLVMLDKKTGKEVSQAVINNVTVAYYRDGAKTTDFKSPGTITVEATAKAGTAYEGKISTTYNIVGQQIGAYANVEAIADQAYTGAAITPDVKVVSKDGKVTLVKDTDYTVAYSANTNVGTATVIIQGIGKYSGQIASTFNITATDIKDAVVTVAEGTYTYNGKAQTPSVTVKLGDAVLSAADYDVAYAKNTNAGTATVTVTGKGNCTGTPAAATFVIAKADQKLAVSKAITDALKIRNTNANTYTLKVTGAGTKLSYKSSDAKIASVNAAGKISFKHVCGKATITVTAAADDNYNAATLKVAVAVKPATPSITIAAREKGFNAKATAVKDITGYQVGYSTDKNFAAAKTTKKLVKTTRALNKNFSGLSAKKGYYVRVRAYKKVGSTVYWGNWTSAKKITTK